LSNPSAPGTTGIYYSNALTYYNPGSTANPQFYISGDLFPTTNNTYSLGKTGAAWKNINLGTINGSAYPPTGTIPTLGQVMTAGAIASTGLNMGGNVITNFTAIGANTETVVIPGWLSSTNSGSSSVNFGFGAGKTTAGGSQPSNCVAIGYQAGNSQQQNSVAVGYGASEITTGGYNVAVGSVAGQTNQGMGLFGGLAVAVGNSAGQFSQGQYATAIGSSAAQFSQGTGAIAVGNVAGQTTQGIGSIAIGRNSGNASQGSNAVAIGPNAGQGTTSGQGANAIAIGNNAGVASQTANSICLNASGIAVNPAVAGLHIDPIRNDTTKQNQVQYNTNSKEVSYVAQVVSPVTTGGLDLTGNAALLSTTAGSISTNFLVVVINGTTYKIELKNNA
jgi:hypothetical protein